MIDPIQILSLHHRIAPLKSALECVQKTESISRPNLGETSYCLSASNLHLAKSAIGKNTLRATARLLNGKSTAGVTAALASCGCLSESNPERPQKVWGRRGFSPGRFLKPRAITIDEQDRLYIVDTTGRIQVFDTEGNFLHQWKTPQTQNGRPTGLAFEQVKSDPPPQSLLKSSMIQTVMIQTVMIHESSLQIPITIECFPHPKG